MQKIYMMCQFGKFASTLSDGQTSLVRNLWICCLVPLLKEPELNLIFAGVI